MLRTRGPGGGLPRLRYTLNPLLACASKSLQGHFVARVTDLLPALEAVAAIPEIRRHPPIDLEIAAFLAARSEQRIEVELTNLTDAGHPEVVALAQLRLLAGLQLRQPARKVPTLAAWLVEQLHPALATWRNRERRDRLGRELAGLTGAGQLAPMLALLQDPQIRADDAQEYQDAMLTVADIDAELLRITSGGLPRADAARRIAQEAALVLGSMTLAVAAVAAVLS